MKNLMHLLVLLLLFSMGSARAQPPAPHYALIVDAGSTGSRLHLFEYTHEAKIPLIHELFSESVKPGLSSYAKNPQEAGPSLKKPLDDALAELRKKQINPAKVQLSVLATAGMRLLNADQQRAIYKELFLYLRSRYPFPIPEIKTLSGEMEGLFGWLDLNYLAGTFNSERDSTLGSIDVGGASIQLVFSTLDASQPQNEFKLHLGTQYYLVYSKSFLGLGLNEALNQVNQQALAARCYPAHYALSTGEKGSFNSKDCGVLYTNLLNQQSPAAQIPSLAGKEFLAYSGAYYTFNFFQVNAPSKAALENQVQAVCDQSWEQLLAAYPKETESYLSKYCASGVYLSRLLFDTYHLQANQLRVSNQINQHNLDWTLGALLYQLVQA